MSASLQRQLPHASSVSLNGRQVPYVTVANPRRKSISIYWTGRLKAFRPVVIAMAVLFLTAADRPCLSLVRSALSS